MRVVDLDVLEVARQYVRRMSLLENGGETTFSAGQSPVDEFARRIGFRVAGGGGLWGCRFGKSKMRRKWLYDAGSLTVLAENCGFVCSLREFRDSAIPDIDAVERDEWIDTFSIEGEKRI